MSNLDIRVQRKNIGRIIKSSRIFYGITQNKAAEILNVTQSTISKIECGDLEPGIHSWSNYLKYTNIKDLTCYQAGYFELPTIAAIAKLNDNYATTSGGFKIPKKYAQNKSITVKKILPLIEYIDMKAGPALFNKFLKELKMRREYFYILNNPLNTHFELDLIQLILDNKLLSSLKDISSIQNFALHGSLASKYQSFKQSKLLIEYFIQKQSKYGINILYDMQKMQDNIIINTVENDLIRQYRDVDSLLMKCFEEFNLYFPYNLQINRDDSFMLGQNCHYSNGKGCLELVA